MDDRFSMSHASVTQWSVVALLAITALACVSMSECSRPEDANTTNIKSPIQILPSRFPPPIEKWVERIQNYFSTYNHPDLQNRPYTPQTSSAPTSTEPSTSPDPPVEEEFATELHVEIITTTDEYVDEDA